MSLQIRSMVSTEDFFRHVSNKTVVEPVSSDTDQKHRDKGKDNEGKQELFSEREFDVEIIHNNENAFLLICR